MNCYQACPTVNASSIPDNIVPSHDRALGFLGGIQVNLSHHPGFPGQAFSETMESDGGQWKRVLRLTREK